MGQDRATTWGPFYLVGNPIFQISILFLYSNALKSSQTIPNFEEIYIMFSRLGHIKDGHGQFLYILFPLKVL